MAADSVSMLRAFNDQIVGEGLERLKLILFPLIQWNRLKDLDTAYEMYEELLLIKDYNTEEKAMEMFLFAIKAIGGSERGKFCAAVAKKKIPLIGELEFSSQSRKFRFFFWLLKVERRLPRRFKNNVLKHFAKVLTTNHKLYRGSVPRLFIHLYQRGIINEDETGALKEYLVKCRDLANDYAQDFVNLNKCISYITNFQREEDEEPFTSADEESTAISMQETDNDGFTEERSFKKKVVNRSSTYRNRSCTDPNPETTQDQIVNELGRSAPDGRENLKSARQDWSELSEVLFIPKTNSALSPPARNLDESESHGNTDTEESGQFKRPRARKKSDHEIPCTPAQSDLNTEIITGEKSIVQFLKRKKMCNIILILITAVIVITAIIISSVVVWKPLSEVSSSHDIEYREKSVPILVQFKPFFVKHLDVKQELDLGDSAHTVDVYLTKGLCDDLPSITTNYEYNTSHYPDTIPVYMLKGSVVSLNVNASTKQPEINPLFFYIIKTVESNFHYSTNLKKGRHRISIGINNTTKSTKIKLTISSSNYYTFRFTGIPLDVSLKFSLILAIRRINLDNISDSSLVGTLSPNNVNKNVGTKIDFADGYCCLFADIKESAITKTNNYTSLEVNLEPRLNAGLGITLPIVIIISVVFTVLFCICNFRNNRREHYFRI